MRTAGLRVISREDLSRDNVLFGTLYEQKKSRESAFNLKRIFRLEEHAFQFADWNSIRIKPLLVSHKNKSIEYEFVSGDGKITYCYKANIKKYIFLDYELCRPNGGGQDGAHHSISKAEVSIFASDAWRKYINDRRIAAHFRRLRHLNIRVVSTCSYSIRKQKFRPSLFFDYIDKILSLFRANYYLPNYSSKPSDVIGMERDPTSLPFFIGGRAICKVLRLIDLHYCHSTPNFEFKRIYSRVHPHEEICDGNDYIKTESLNYDLCKQIMVSRIKSSSLNEFFRSNIFKLVLPNRSQVLPKVISEPVYLVNIDFFENCRCSKFSTLKETGGNVFVVEVNPIEFLTFILLPQ